MDMSNRIFRLTVLLTQEERQKVESAAKAAGQTVSGYVRWKILNSKE